MNKINNVSVEEIIAAITLLHQAGLDTSSVTMSLSHHIGQEDKSEKVVKAVEVVTAKKEECEHNWVLDGHNSGEGICSKCFSR